MTVLTMEAIPAGTPLRCSFCWRTGRQIRVLAVGCEVNICDVCVRACSRRIAQHVAPDARAEYEALVVALALVDRGVSAEVGPVQAATRSVIRERLRDLERNTPRGEPIVMTRVVEPGVASECKDTSANDAPPLATGDHRA